MSGEPRPGGVAEPDDELIHGLLRRMWDAEDPAPADLADSVVFALSLEYLEVELLTLRQLAAGPVGARGEEAVRTLTFNGTSITVMVTLGGETGAARIDGWIVEGGGLEVELRREGGAQRRRAGSDGRFAFDGLAPGLAQLVFHPTQGAGVRLERPVVTPPITLG